MGNWRCVQIIGTVSEVDLPALREECRKREDWSNFHCLTTSPSICGLNNWPGTQMDAIGNLAERDYDVEDVARQLRKLVEAAPSLTLQLHCGGDYEDKTCIATIVVAEGQVGVLEPRIERIPEFTDQQLESNMIRALMNARRF